MKFQTVKGVRFLTFDIFPKKVKHAIFTRQGGLSPEPWSSLNVGGTVGDEKERVQENRFRSFAALGRNRNSIFDVWQVHSADVVIANTASFRKNGIPEFKADGILTDNPEVSLFMRFADCTPVMLYDRRQNVVGIVHAGWQGTVKHTAGNSVKMMQAVYGSKPREILAAIGPAIGPDHYEVGPNVVEQVQLAFGKAAEELLPNRDGKTYFNLWAANRLALEQAGVEQIEVAEICTACHPEDWFSHRAQKGRTGRYGALICLEDENSSTLT